MTLLLIALALLCLVAGIIFMFYIRPAPKQSKPVSERVESFSQVDPDMGPLEGMAQRRKAERVNSVADVNLKAAQNLSELQKQYEEAVISEATAEPKLKQALLTLENQNYILERATAIGVPVQDYTKYIIKVLESQTALMTEAMSIRLTIEIAIATSERHFAKMNQLRQQIRDYRVELFNLKNNKQLPEPVKEIEIFSLEAQIKTFEARLSDHLKQTGVSEAHG